jgi:hypothetical protein
LRQSWRTSGKLHGPTLNPFSVLVSFNRETESVN